MGSSHKAKSLPLPPLPPPLSSPYPNQCNINSNI